MTQKIFWANPYQTSLDTTVTSVAQTDVTLASTIFFAFSGGQESDHGSIAGQPVIAAVKVGREIVYTLAPDHGLHIGQTVQVGIDWARRYRLMRLHFAAELVLELVYRALPGVEKTGAHIASDKARIDFAWPQSVAPLLADLTVQANRIIGADLPITTGWDDEPNERRYWEIEGFSRVPCGGTHVRATGEIGPVRLRRNNRGRGLERVEIYLADNAQ
jgi:Ser-tRNA(Ala) deacylase AlaX